MKRVNQYDKTCIEFRGIHPAGMVGIVIALFVSFPLVGIGLSFFENKTQPDLLIVIMLLGGVFLVGLCLAGLRRRIHCDVNREQVKVDTILLFLPLSSKVLSSKTATNIEVSRQSHKTKNALRIEIQSF